MESTLTQLLEWRVDRVQDYCGRLVAPLLERADELGLMVDRSRDRSAHIVGLRFQDGRAAASVGPALAARGIHVSVRGDALRVAPNVYNDDADIAALIDGLEVDVDR
jgi:selenocysteine lyase/cysteine desulfurase